MRIPLGAIDKKLERFAKAIGGSISKKEPKGQWVPDGFDERSVTWTTEDFRYTIAIFPVLKNEQIRKWSVSAWCVYQKGYDSYTANRILIETRKINRIIADFDQLLADAVSYLQGLRFEDLEIRRRPPHLS